MPKKLLSKIYRNQKGITGLETAIILIAFVVVAAVFAYTVLSAGLFATEKSSEAVYSGLQETKSTVELRGGVTVYASGHGAGLTEEVHTSGGATPTTTSSVATRIQFAVANVLGGEPIDLTPAFTATAADPPNTLAATGTDNHVCIISYMDQYNLFQDCAWTVEWIGNHNQDNLLEQDEKALITVWLAPHDGTDFNLAAAGSTRYFDDADDTAGHILGTSEQFTIEMKSAKGAVLTLERTTPAYLDPVNDMH